VRPHRHERGRRRRNIGVGERDGGAKSNTLCGFKAGHQRLRQNRVRNTARESSYPKKHYTERGVNLKQEKREHSMENAPIRRGQ